MNALRERGIDTTEHATNAALARTAHEIGLPSPTAAARARIQNLVATTFPTPEP